MTARSLLLSISQVLEKGKLENNTFLLSLYCNYEELRLNMKIICSYKFIYLDLDYQNKNLVFNSAPTNGAKINFITMSILPATLSKSLPICSNCHKSIVFREDINPLNGATDLEFE